MTENSTGPTADETVVIDAEVGTPTAQQRPGRKFVSFDSDDDMAYLRVTPRFKRNARRVAAVGAVAAIMPPMAPAAAVVGAYQAWQDYGNSTMARHRYSD